MAEELQKLSPEELKALREELEKEAFGSDESEDEDLLEEEESGEQGPVQSGKSITVEVAEDKMSASVTLSAPNPGEYYSVPEIIGALRSNRVVLGLKSDVITDLVSEEIYEEPVVIAEGKEVEPGVEGYYEFAIDMTPHKTPEIREDGTCDYSAMCKLANVAENDLIARYHPAVQGTKGYNVIGAEILPKFAKDQPVLRGKYIVYNPETLEYHATVSGKISCSNNNVEILTVHEISGDIDITMGNVEFYGDIVITGNVEAGVLIRAGRNVTINGTVAAANIFAGGDVVLAKGIQGNNKGRISARGSVFAEFIEYATVDAQGDVQSNSIINSMVNAGGKVVVDGKRGIVVGGYTHGLKGVTFRTSGNYSEIKTDIHAGYKPEEYETYLGIVKSEKECRAKAEEVVEEIGELLKIAQKKGITQGQKERIMELNTMKDAIYRNIEEIERDKKFLSAKMSEGVNASITSKGTVHVNTLIGIDIAQVKILKEENYLKYICKNGEIERRTVPVGS